MKKQYTIFYNKEDGRLTSWEVIEEKGFLKNVLVYFSSSTGVSVNEIISFHTYDVPVKDELIEFLDNNPATPTEETKEPTQEEKEAAWQEDLYEHNRMQAEEINYYNPKTL